MGKPQFNRGLPVDAGNTAVRTATLATGATATRMRNTAFAAVVTVFAANATRQQVIIQNIGTVVLAVKYGAGATTIDYDFLLAAGSVANDGKGGFLIESVYKGQITVIPMAGNGAVVASEVTP